ncbi:hypothetical protein [Clostridium sp. OS1-26]|uniref:hypothetical protein n=1 Tax=Clostridium sp. OS1-26 TaxID=3070681 RepID=UPI0027E1105E|nr:hypothetical protein [Clostridium sp. OS1-26]WML37243.1 hypothetical protein RCG18_11850 [Clostridium sp. OS1-26]
MFFSIKTSTSSNELIKLYSDIISFFQLIGFPTIDVAFQLIRLRKPLTTYFKIKKFG